MTHGQSPGSDRRQRLRRAQLYLLLTESLCRHPLTATLEAALRGGVDIIQLREKQLSPPDLLRYVARVLDQIGGRALVIVNDELRAARELPVDGLHIGQSDATPGRARRAIGPERLLGISTHDRGEVEAARSEADYLGFGTVFPSRTRGNAEGTGPRQPAAIQRLVPDRPVFAIGGIDEKNVHELASVGVRRIAVCQAILGAEDPEDASRRLKRALGPLDEFEPPPS